LGKKRPSGGNLAKANIHTSRSNIKQNSLKARNPLYEGRPRGDNPLYERSKLKSDENPDRNRILTAVLPKNNTRFSQEKPVKELRWQLLGDHIPLPKYIVELQRVDAQGRPAQSYHATSENLSVSMEQMAKGALPDGMYR